MTIMIKLFLNQSRGIPLRFRHLVRRFDMNDHKQFKIIRFKISIILLLGILVPFLVDAQQKKPNIVVIFADDVGIWNISAYHRGMMGGSTPNIDRIAKEGALFTDYYG